MSAREPHPADELILSAAARPGGFTCQPLAGVSDKSVDHRCRQLEKAGKLHRAKISHRVVRWYDTAERAQAAMDKVHVDRSRRVAVAVAAKPRMLDQRSDGIITERTKVTICPPFVPRFQEPVGAVQFGLQRGRVTR